MATALCLFSVPLEAGTITGQIQTARPAACEARKEDWIEAASGLQTAGGNALVHISVA